MIPALVGRRVALVHHWLLSMRGGERVLEAIADLVPHAPIFTLFARPDQLSPALRNRDIRPSFLNSLPAWLGDHRNLLPLFPLAARSLDCRAFDVVLISDAALTKGVRVDAGAAVLCYCHSPMRSIWDLTASYARQLGPVRGTALRLIRGPLRTRDRHAAERVDHFAANSQFVRQRIFRAYARDSTVIHPPVRVAETCPPRQPQDFYLMVGELTEYKRTDVGAEACMKLRRKLRVIGDGPHMPRLRKLAGPAVELIGRASDQAIRDSLSRCRALLFCAEEDFGIVPVEAMAAGCPVIALGRGGAAETVIDGRTGLLFPEQSPDSLINAIRRFEADQTRFDPEVLHARAMEFSPRIFARKFTRWITECLGAATHSTRQQPGP